MEKQTDLFSRLFKRENRQLSQYNISRFEKGNENELIKIREFSRFNPIILKIFIVQPGLSKKKSSTEQLSLLSVTENYLMETYKLPFTVIASP